MNATVDTLDYIAVAHLDWRAREIARLMLAHADNPTVLVERIADWADDNCTCQHVHDDEWL